jgi:hypothetical protein
MVDMAGLICFHICNGKPLPHSLAFLFRMGATGRQIQASLDNVSPNSPVIACVVYVPAHEKKVKSGNGREVSDNTSQDFDGQTL